MGSFMHFRGLFGIAVFLAIAWIISEKRKSVKYMAVLAGVGLQFTIAAILLYLMVSTLLSVPYLFWRRKVGEARPHPSQPASQ